MASQFGPHRLIRAVAAAACVVALAAPASAFADVATHTTAEIQARYEQLRPTYAGSPYVFAPSIAAPYSTGVVATAELQDGLNAINYARFLAGLPDDVSLDATLDSNAQHGAVLMAATRVFEHEQPMPAGMSEDFYDIGNNATKSSNIGLGYAHLAAFNTGCLGDSDSDNIDRLGHRRWLLYPPMAKTGMGIANGRTVTWAFDHSRRPVFAYTTIKWPAAGNFPAEMMSKNDAWSIQLNPALYGYTAGTAGHTITLRRVADGHTWTFTSADTDVSGEYFNFETHNYGIPNCFVFRPNPSSVGGYQNGDVFDVTLSGGITDKATGQPTTISYRTTFVSQSTGRAVVLGTSTSITGPRSVKCNRTITVRGNVTPASARGRVLIVKTRLLHGKWVSMGSVRVSVSSSGAYSYGFKPSKRGQWHVTATYCGNSGLTAYSTSKSGTLSVKVQ